MASMAYGRTPVSFVIVKQHFFLLSPACIFEGNNMKSDSALLKFIFARSMLYFPIFSQCQCELQTANAKVLSAIKYE